MLDKLAAVESRYAEICFRSEQPDFYNDPKKAAAYLRSGTTWSPSWRLTRLTGLRSRIWPMPRS